MRKSGKKHYFFSDRECIRYCLVIYVTICRKQSYLSKISSRDFILLNDAATCVTVRLKLVLSIGLLLVKSDYKLLCLRYKYLSSNTVVQCNLFNISYLQDQSLNLKCS